MKDKRPNRSDAYQFKLLELPCDMSPQSVAASWDTSRSLYPSSSISNDAERQARGVVAGLCENAFKRMQELMTRYASATQNKVWDGLLQGMTQVEMAKLYDVNQSSIVKVISGNTATAKGSKLKYYGGIRNKLPKLLLSDEPFRLIMKQLYDLDQPSNLLYLIRTFFENQEDYLDFLETPIDQELGIQRWKRQACQKLLAQYFFDKKRNIVKNMAPVTVNNLCEQIQITHIKVNKILQLDFNIIQDILIDLKRKAIDQEANRLNMEGDTDLKANKKVSYTPLNLIPPSICREKVPNIIKNNLSTKRHLTQKQKQWLAQDYQRGVSCKELVITYGICATSVYAILDENNLSRKPYYDPILQIKECKACHAVKPLTDFFGQPASISKRGSYCKTCAMAKDRERKVRRSVIQTS